MQYPLYEDGNTFKYDFAAMKEMVQRENPKVLLIASPNNPTGNGLTPGAGVTVGMNPFNLSNT